MLSLFTIYERPRDFPQSFVVREYVIGRDQMVASDVLVLAPTLSEVRAALRELRPGLVCIGREPGDDPVIVESWV